VRGCLRARGLTLDAKVVLGTLPIYWIDPLLNALQPSFFYSSNFVNVANWCGDMPLVRNAECGRLPEPVLLLWPIYTFGVYVIAKAFVAIMHRVKHRWPRMSNTELVALTLILVAMFDAGIEQAGLRFNLWAYPGYPDALSVGGGVHKLPFIEMTFIAIWVGGTACLYYFRDDRGRTIVEQGLERLSPPRRTVVEISAIHGVIASLFMVGTMLNVAAGLWSSKYPEMPAYLVNRLCDAPGVTGTDYGPCPGGTNGSREWRIPINQP
jgi:hypothetical protein